LTEIGKFIANIATLVYMYKTLINLWQSALLLWEREKC